MFFPNPLPETIFGGSKCQPMLESMILEPFWIQGYPKNGPFGHHFRSEKLQKATTPNYQSRPGADLVATWRRKRSQNISSSISGRFLTDFGRVSNDFRLFFNDTCQNFSMDFFAFLRKRRKCVISEVLT